MQETMIPTWTLADRLRKAREHAGLEQSELADRMGVGRNTVSNYERAAHEPREIVLRAWATATGVPLEWLRTGLPRLDSNQEPAGDRTAGYPAGGYRSSLVLAA